MTTRLHLPVTTCKLVAAHVAGAALFAGCQVVGAAFPELKRDLFCRLAAFFTSHFLGVPYLQTPEGFFLAHPLLDVHVTEACSGFDFFTLLYATLSGITVCHSARCMLPVALLLLLPLSFVLTVGANTARIICAIHARLFSNLLPVVSANAIHLAVGVFVFATVLAASSHAARFLYAKR